MAQGQRRGSPVSLWGSLSAAKPPVQTAVAVAAGNTSNAVQLGRYVNNVAFYITTNGASAFTVQVAHSGGTSAGTLPDPDDQTFVWHDAYYLGTGTNGSVLTVTFAAAGSIAMIVPDFEPNWIRLKRTDGGASVNVVAGHEAWGD